MRETKQQPIDVVITWVDGNDPKWQNEKQAYLKQTGHAVEGDDRKERYRDWDNLQYWFRGAERYAPWIRKIHFVTYGHLPPWLNTNHPKLHIVNHRDFIPEEFLPTFNSHTIEWNLHRIPDLADCFVYFNDDVFFLKKTAATDFFRNGRPVDMLAFQPDVANTENPVMPYIYLNNTMLLAKYFEKYSNIKKQPGAYFHIGYPPLYFFYNMLELVFPRFTGFYTVHGPSPFRKETYETLWDLEPELLRTVCSHPLRQKEDVSQYVLREFQKLDGKFVPHNVKKLCGYYEIGQHNEKLIRAIRQQKHPLLCLNDGNCEFDFETAREQINAALEHVFSERSSFEKEVQY